MTDAPRSRKQAPPPEGALVTTEGRKGSDAISMTPQGIRLSTLEDAWRFAQYVIDAKLAPAGMTSPSQVLVAMQAGMELGFTPMRALSVMKVINGHAGPMTTAAKAKIRSAGVLKPGTAIEEWIEVDGARVETLTSADLKKAVAKVRTHRGDETYPTETAFSWADAERAGLTVKQTYKQYPQRMILHRARGFHFDDHFSDVLLGMHIAEVLPDYPPVLGVAGEDQSVTLLELEGGGQDPLLAALDEIESEPVLVDPEPEKAAPEAPAEPVAPEAPAEPAEGGTVIGKSRADEIRVLIRDRAAKFLPQHQAGAVEQITDGILDRYKIKHLEQIPEGEVDAVRTAVLNAKIAT